MAYNGADSAGNSTLNPSTTLGGSSGQHDITPADIAVIVGAVVVFFLIVFGVFYYRQLRARQERARAAEQEQQLNKEMRSVYHAGCGEDGKKHASDDGGAAPLWKYIGWKDDKGTEKVKEVEMTRASTVEDVRGDTHHGNGTGQVHSA